MLFTVIFALVGGYAFYQSFPPAIVVTFLIVSAAFLIVTVFSPQLLKPLNRAWFALGKLLGKIVGPLVLGLIFFLVFTPVAIIMRLSGRDALKLRKQTIQSYWVDRNPVGPAPNSFKDQF